MTVEERGRNEELSQEASSAELSPSEAADATETETSTSETEVATEAAGETEALNGDVTIELDAPAEASAQDAAPVAGEANAAADSEKTETPTAEAPVAAEPESSPTVSDTDESGGDVLIELEAPAEASAQDAAPVAGEVDAAADSEETETPTAEAPVAAEPESSSTESDADGSGGEAQAAPAEEKPADPEPESKPAAEEPKYKRGQVYHGVISETTPTAVFVELGDGDRGVVPGRELELMTRKMLESLTVGAEVDVYVVNPRNHRGETILSINHALEVLDWRNAQKYAKSKEVYEARVGGYNKGGLIVRFGRLRGFVPQSQLAEERIRNMSGETPEERYGPMVNQPIGVKVMEVDRHRNRLILSERAALREVRQSRKESLISELTVGEIRKGKVVSLENFGAFVDIGGGEGLVHLSELTWGHITHPRQAVKLGEEVEVEVISVDPKTKRIGLSRRRILGDPWDEIATSLRRGQLVRGRVTKLTKFGAFARLIDNEAVEGLIHISELASDRVNHPREVVQRGDELALRIVKIDIKERRLGLSLKSVQSTEYLDLDWEMAIQDSASLPPVDAVADAPVDAVAEAPADVVAEAPTDVIAEAPTDAVAEAPADAVAEAPAEQAEADTGE